MRDQSLLFTQGRQALLPRLLKLKVSERPLANELAQQTIRVKFDYAILNELLEQ